jgi:hypothetical protein
MSKIFDIVAAIAILNMWGSLALAADPVVSV